MVWLAMRKAPGEYAAFTSIARTETVVTEDQWDLAQQRALRFRVLGGAGGLGAIGVLSLPAMSLGAAAASGGIRYLYSAVFLVVFLAPVVWALVRSTNKEQRSADATVRELNAELSEAARTADRESAQRRVQARRQRFESRLANALDMADGEPEVIDVIERSFASVLSDSPVELLLADNSHAHLLRMASVSPTGEPPACGVDSPDRCPAARRAQVQRFSDSDNLDACPKLRNRPQGRLSALCVPVSIMGRTVGVIHATGAPQVEVEEDTVEDLATLAKLAGARIGLLRVMAETQLQAATDSLTGLFNRRMFTEKLSAVRRENNVVAVAMIDLDHFKILNDTYGHDTGDRALVLFAQVLREGFRSQDLFCRHGGEEFAIAFLSCTGIQARHALDALRFRLSAAVAVAGLPAFTISVGVVDTDVHENLPEILARADVALYEAKRNGRDQVVVHNFTGQTVQPIEEHDEVLAQPGADIADIRRQLR
jgi:diguanylate cyclase (GGDEF)-like protein